MPIRKTPGAKVRAELRLRPAELKKVTPTKADAAPVGESFAKLLLAASAFEGGGTGLLPALKEPALMATPEAAGAMALQGCAPARPGDPYAGWVEGIRAELKSKGLPTRADGVRIRVIDTGLQHGMDCTRAAAGPLGFGRGADVAVSTAHRRDRPEGYRPTTGESEPEEARFERFAAVRTGAADLDQVVAVMGDWARGVVFNRRRSLQTVRNEARERGDPITVLSMSWSAPIEVHVRSMVDGIKRQPDGTPLKEAIEKLLADAGIPKEDRHARGRYLMRFLGRRLEEHLAQDPIHREARTALNDDLHAARDEGILTFASAGNSMSSEEVFGDKRFCENELAQLDGVITVGATDLSGETAGFSGTGRVATVGVDVPCGALKQNGFGLVGPLAQALKSVDSAPLSNERVTGTSFAAPNAAGIAALMSRANPALDAHQLAELLGQGVLDPVALVEAAANAG